MFQDRLQKNEFFYLKWSGLPQAAHTIIAVKYYWCFQDHVYNLETTQLVPYTQVGSRTPPLSLSLFLPLSLQSCVAFLTQEAFNKVLKIMATII